MTAHLRPWALSQRREEIVPGLRHERSLQCTGIKLVDILELVLGDHQ